MKKILIIAAIIIVVLGAAVLLFVFGGGQTASNTSTSTPQANGPAQVNNDFSHVPGDQELLNNLKVAQLDALNSEGTVMHIHQHLDLIVNNQTVAIPSEIGVGTNFISPIHTHDATGILHVESPVQKDFTLNQFFQEWGIDFSNNCIGKNCADNSRKLVVAVNGNPVSDVSHMVLSPHEEIEIWYGDKNTNPDLIKSYNFPQGY